MTAPKGSVAAAPRRYQSKKHQRWPMRILISMLSLGGMLGIWQFVAHEPAASAHSTPSFQDAEQQLQLGNNNNNVQGDNPFQSAPGAPNTSSGVS